MQLPVLEATVLMILLSKEEHNKVLLNASVNLKWTNVGGVFVGPYVSEKDYEKWIKNK